MQTQICGQPERRASPDAQACAHCGAPAEQGPYREAVCLACAMRLGAEEARARNATRGGTPT